MKSILETIRPCLRAAREQGESMSKKKCDNCGRELVRFHDEWICPTQSVDVLEDHIECLRLWRTMDMVTLEEVLDFIEVEMEESPGVRARRGDCLFDYDSPDWRESCRFWKGVVVHYIKEGYDGLDDVLDSIGTELFKLKLDELSGLGYASIKGPPVDSPRGPSGPLSSS